jgi:hypothetical protein
MTTIARLCDICQEIFTQKKRTSNSFPHHRNIHELIKAVDIGCDLCRLLRSRFSTQEKLLMGVDWDDPSGSKVSLTSYKLSDGKWQSSVLRVFDFLGPNNGHDGKEVTFLFLKGRKVYNMLEETKPLLTYLENILVHHIHI